MDLFFALSAFLITELLLRELETTSRVRIGRFYARRALRIWPLYFAFLGLVWAVQAVVLGDERAAPYYPAFLTFLGNWTCARQGFPPSPIAPLWSVSIEEQFYVVWPVLFVLLVRSRRVLEGSLAAVAISWVARLMVSQPGLPPTAMECNTLCRLDPMAMGVLLVLLRRSSWGRLFSPWLGLVGVGLLVLAVRYSLRLIRPFVSPSDPGVPGERPGVGVHLDGGPLSSEGSVETRSHALGNDYLGRISYGLYVFHAAALALAEGFLPGSVALRVICGCGGDAGDGVPVVSLLRASPVEA